MSSCFRSWSCSASHRNVPKPLDQHQLTLTATGSSVTGGPPPPGCDFTMRRQFEARLNNSWRTALFIKWYAVLINVVEACFAIYEIGKQNRKHRERPRTAEEGRFPDSAFRRNLHLAMATLMLMSNGAAIVGLLTQNFILLLPYYFLHVATLVLELNYVVIRVATTAVSWTGSGKSGNQNTAWRTLATLAYITFNLLIMIGAEFGSSGGAVLWPGYPPYWHW